MINVGIIGGGGYTAGELIRILSGHPDVVLSFVYSNSQAGKKVYEVHHDLLYLKDLSFSGEVQEADVLFLCQGHGQAKAFMDSNILSEDTLVIDLGNDFRIENENWVYGLPERNRNKIAGSQRIANSGCFATAIQLAILPLALSKKLTEDIHVSATTGSTGAGQKLQPTTHFTWRNNNISVYKAFDHQHEAEIYQSIHALQNGFNGKVWFLPHRGDFTRGILASTYTKSDLSEDQARELYIEYYKDHPFTIITDQAISLKQVVNTNYCYLHLSKHGDMLLIQSVIDNLIKGASGQAIQNMNIALGIEESSGLNLKPIAY
jgi:N-acetyl-gamma-glutamyl-phosphate reductase